MKNGEHPRPWRVGRKVGRTVYDANGNLIGVMDTKADAELVVWANAMALIPDEPVTKES